MTKVKSLVSRRRLIGASLMIALLVLAIGQLNPRSTSAQGGFESAIFTVKPRTGTFNVTSTTPGSTFAFVGDITLVNARNQPLTGDDGSKGTFYRSGVIMDSSGAALVNDVYILTTSNGYITATGVIKNVVTSGIGEGNLLAVTGGVGTFRSVVGEAQLLINDTDGSFTVTLVEGLRRLGQFREIIQGMN
jgi:hypothetical protein